MREGQIGAFQDKEFGPLPILLTKKLKKRDQKIIDKIASIYEKQGSDCWFRRKNFLGDDYDAKDYEN